MRIEELIKRGHLDPLSVDKRALREILNDEIPYERWATEKAEGKPYHPTPLLPRDPEND